MLREWIHKQDPAFCSLQETHLNLKDRHYLRVKDWEKVFQSNGPNKQVGVAIQILQHAAPASRRDDCNRILLRTHFIGALTLEV